MRITINLNGLDKKLRSAPESLRKKIHDRLRSKTQEIKSIAKRRAPSSSGRLREAIYGRTYKNPLRASVGIYGTLSGSSGFPYALFATGKITIRTRSKFNPYFAAGQTIRYGSTAYAPSGNPIQWTADPQWWNQIESRARKAYPATVGRAVSDWAKEMNS